MAELNNVIVKLELLPLPMADGISDRVESLTSDMTTLQFADHSFAVVVSNVAIHNGQMAGWSARGD